MSALDKDELGRLAESVSFWWHSIQLGKGVTTKGHKSVEHLTWEYQALRLPDLRGKSVLDVGAWDGFFSFEAERRGAQRVVALDQWRQPGFEIARQALSSKVEGLVGDFMSMDLDKLGTFDFVLFLGMLYHMQNPLESLKRLAAVTREMAVIETEAVAFPGYEQHGLCEFFEADELLGDSSNWWAPNEKALAGMCRAAGFGRVQTLVGPGQPPQTESLPEPIMKRLRRSLPYVLNGSGVTKKLGVSRLAAKRLIEPSKPKVHRYRAIVQAWK
jgi:tRNA (mo5U34)-methyltransferase